MNIISVSHKGHESSIAASVPFRQPASVLLVGNAPDYDAMAFLRELNTANSSAENAYQILPLAKNIMTKRMKRALLLLALALTLSAYRHFSG